ncbi:hypothetical protein [Micromonospora sediminicola]|uniref:hypothetical protein n=1 Tax=Micromonospora sediminicola TaxID=946078 RepID=UPI0037977760
MSHGTAAKDREGEPETTGEPAPGPREVLLAISRYLWERARDTRGSNWPPLWLVLAVAGAGVGVVLMLIVPVVRGLLFAVGDSIAALSGWAHEQAYAQVVLAPVRRYLDAHTDGLPIAAETLWWTWCATGIVLLAASVLRVVAARIGWILYAVATTAMVVSATPGAGRWTAAAISALWWVLLSIPAFGRRRSSAVLVLPAQPTGAAPALPAPADATERANLSVSGPISPSIPDDYAAWAAALYERQIRRADCAPPAATPVTWTAAATGPTTFTAVEGNRRVSGIVINGLAAEDLLRQLATPAGASVTVQWTTNPPQTPRRRRATDEGYAGTPPIADFVTGNADALQILNGQVVSGSRVSPV